MATQSHTQSTLGTSLPPAAITATPPRPKIHPSQLWEIVPVVLGLLWLVFSFYPIIYMLVTSFRTQGDVYTDTPWSLPSHPTLENYANVLTNGFFTYFFNTVFVTVVSVFMILVVSAGRLRYLTGTQPLYSRRF
jgi:raffinose/stachyose/melibiose transport system permease protein